MAHLCSPISHLLAKPIGNGEATEAPGQSNHQRGPAPLLAVCQTNVFPASWGCWRVENRVASCLRDNGDSCGHACAEDTPSSKPQLRSCWLPGFQVQALVYLHSAEGGLILRSPED